MTNAGSYTGVANAKEFEQSHRRVIAQGFDTERWFEEGEAVGTGGILMPEPTRLPPGIIIIASPAACLQNLLRLEADGGSTLRRSK
jgi:hypothetical protein